MTAPTPTEAAGLLPCRAPIAWDGVDTITEVCDRPVVRGHHRCDLGRATTPGDDRGRELAERIEHALRRVVKIDQEEGLIWTVDPTRHVTDLGAVETHSFPSFARALAAPAETEAGDGVRALVDRDGHRWIELATDRWWCLPDPAEGVDSIIGPDEVVEPGRSRASVERTDGPVREVRLAATPPEAEGEAGNLRELARAVRDARDDAAEGKGADAVQPLDDVARHLDRIAGVAATFPAPAGPQAEAEGAGETAEARTVPIPADLRTVRERVIHVVAYQQACTRSDRYSAVTIADALDAAGLLADDEPAPAGPQAEGAGGDHA